MRIRGRPAWICALLLLTLATTAVAAQDHPVDPAARGNEENVDGASWGFLGTVLIVVIPAALILFLDGTNKRRWDEERHLRNSIFWTIITVVGLVYSLFSGWTFPYGAEAVLDVEEVLADYEDGNFTTYEPGNALLIEDYILVAQTFDSGSEDWFYLTIGPDQDQNITFVFQDSQGTLTTSLYDAFSHGDRIVLRTEVVEIDGKEGLANAHFENATHYDDDSSLLLFQRYVLIFPGWVVVAVGLVNAIINYIPGKRPHWAGERDEEE